MSDIDISVGTEYDEGLKRVETDVQTVDELFAEAAGAAGQFSSALLSAYSQDDSNLVAKIIAQEQFNTQLSAAQGVVAAMTEEEKIAYMAGLELADATEQAGEKAKGAKGGFQLFGLSLTDLKSGIGLAKDVLDKFKEAWEFAKAGAENERIADSFAETAASVNVSAEQMSAALDRAAKGTVDDEIFMQTATRNMALGVATTIQDNVAIMEMARASTRKFGGDTESAFEGISTAIGNLQTRQLKQYGIIIDAKQVNEDYAKTLGKTADQLTEAEQREALRNEVLRQSKDLVGTVGDAALNSAEKFKKFETQAGNVIDSLKELAVDVITPVLDRGEAMQVMMDESASTSDRLTAAYQLQGDYLAGPMRDVADQMIVRLQQQVEQEWELFRAQNMRKVSLDDLTGSVIAGIGAAAQAAGAHQAAIDQQKGLGALYRATVGESAAYNAMLKETADTLRDQRVAYSDAFLMAIDYTQAEQQEAEIKQKLADLDAEIAKNGPARTAVIANERLTVEQRALAEAQLAAALEDTQNLKRRDKETDAEYQVRLESAKNKVAELTAKLGEHAGVVGGATQEQLKQRDALQAQLAEFQRTQEIERATQAFQSLTKAYQDGNITYDEFTVRSKTLNSVTGLYTDAALAAAQSQEALIKSLTTTGSNEWATQMAVNKEAIDGVADSMDTAADKAGTSAEKTGAAAREVVTRSTNAKQTALDEMGVAVNETAQTSSKAISDSMLAMSNAATAAKGVAKSATGEINAAWETVPENVYTDYWIRQHGETPSGGTDLPTRAAGGDVMAGWPYWVGEEGPEPYVPAQNGRILSRTDAMSALSRAGGDTGQIAGALNAMAAAIQGLQRGGDLYLTTGPVLDERTVDELAERVLRAWQSRQ